MTSRYQMCQNAADRLQREAYAKQTAKRKTRIKQFTPCAKGLVYTRECRNGNERPQSLVTREASLTQCDCHPNIGEKELIEYELPRKETK